MKFIVHTLVDITQTGARRGEDVFQYQQQQNFMSFLQALSLRFNPIIDIAPEATQMSIGNMPFGSEYKGKQSVWTVRFETESEIGISLDEIRKDFDYVPIISGLGETVKLPNDVFRTQDSRYNNIILNLDDK